MTRIVKNLFDKIQKTVSKIIRKEIYKTEHTNKEKEAHMKMKLRKIVLLKKKTDR